MSRPDPLTFGEPIATDGGHDLTVRESSMMWPDGRFLWLIAEGPVTVKPGTHQPAPSAEALLGIDGPAVIDQCQGEVGIHLSASQAEELYARLGAWIANERNATRPTTQP